MEEKLKFIQDNWELILSILAGIYTIPVRLFPTSKNWCFVDKALKLIAIILPNRAKDIVYLQKGDTRKTQTVTEVTTHIVK